ncbi:ras guanine nucleotide exchange factor domain-containing protein [Crepidotus variabilis]|uniref:Ras guanine nucleotide exchange factor domain-containing protein n=1 Tax=Crepidotus variabilis TaxID=179855 RepID=A0A9P6EPX9_9AGAR|nr:ras guanine nucleotide exchange factor domain-containing protein [Crepidotus variabilis]
MQSRLAIDTRVGIQAGPTTSASRFKNRSVSPAPTGPSFMGQRGRSMSNASTASSISIISPTSSSTNGSTTSLLLPNLRNGHHSRSPSPGIDDTVRLGPEYVLAMHDYVPATGNATCLAFKAGQVIHVYNRDSSGWWDGEIEGRRGWFPSNYVNAEIASLTEEEEPESFYSRGHSYSQSHSSATSWSTTSTRNQLSQEGHESRPSELTLVEDDEDSHYPPLMTPLLRSISILQNAVRANRITHFQPSAACIISCVRSILSTTGTLQREDPKLKEYPVLGDERRKVLSVLGSLVQQSKKASNLSLDGETQDMEIEQMLRLSGQVFSHVRSFLSIASKCGIDMQEDEGPPTATPATAPVVGSTYLDTPDDEEGDSPSKTPTQRRGRTSMPLPRPELRIAGPRSRERPVTPNSPSHVRTLVQIRQEQYMRDRTPMMHRTADSISSFSSSSSMSSQESLSRPPFPHGPSSTAQMLEALRHTHDDYLSTIAAFIGHAHSHSRTSHASSTATLYDLVKEIIELVCKLLTIVEAAVHHPDVPDNRVGTLKHAKQGLYDVSQSLAEAVRLLMMSAPSTMSEEAEKQGLLRSATGALKAGTDCVNAVKACLTRLSSDKPFIVKLPSMDAIMAQPLTPVWSSAPAPFKSASNRYQLNGMDDEDLTIQAQTPSPIQRTRQISSGSENSNASRSSNNKSDDTRATSPDTTQSITPLPILTSPVEPDLPSPTSFAPTDEDGTTWEGSTRSHQPVRALEEKIVHGELPTLPLEPIPEYTQDPTAWMFGHDYSLDDVAYNSDGHLVGATMDVLVEKMTPHDSIVDPAFAAVFFLTFRLFSSPLELVDAIISRYNLMPPPGITNEDLHLWQQRKGIPVRLRVSNFIKMWVELYWRSGVDNVALTPLTNFTREGLAILFQGPAQRIMDLLNMRRQSDPAISPKLGERARDPGMSINPPSVVTPTGDIPRPSMTKTLLSALRRKDFGNISIMDFDALELARQMTIRECTLYCAIQPEEILESGQEGASPPMNVRAVSTLSTVITGWVAESILDEPDLKKRSLLVKFFVKVADRCTSLNNFSTSRSILAALDSSVISRLRQTWAVLPQKYKVLLEALRRLADHGRNYHEYRSRLRNTAPPAVPFLGLYLTDVTFCREGNPSHRASPLNTNKKILNFNKYHKLARIIQDMQRFQVQYNLKAIPEVQDYLNVAFEKSKDHGDLQDLYRRSLLVEPKQPADHPSAMTSDMRQLFSWASRSNPQSTSST